MDGDFERIIDRSIAKRSKLGSRLPLGGVVGRSSGGSVVDAKGGLTIIMSQDSLGETINEFRVESVEEGKARYTQCHGEMKAGLLAEAELPSDDRATIDVGVIDVLGMTGIWFGSDEPSLVSISTVVCALVPWLSVSSGWKVKKMVKYVVVALSAKVKPLHPLCKLAVATTTTIIEQIKE